MEIKTEAEADEQCGDGQHDADVGLGQQLADERRRESLSKIQNGDVERPT